VEERLLAAIPCTTRLPVQVFAHDESRVGLQTIRRRRITARGVKPQGTVQHDYANCWVYGSIAPSTGERFFLLLPSLDADQMQIFLDEFATAHPSSFNLLLLDNTAHIAKRLKIPSNVGLVFQPAATPELNPAERVWAAVCQVEHRCGIQAVLGGPLSHVPLDTGRGIDQDTIQIEDQGIAAYGIVFRQHVIELWFLTSAHPGTAG
jgi:hypothetical protein